MRQLKDTLISLGIVPKFLIRQIPLGSLQEKRAASRKLTETPFFKAFNPSGIPWMVETCCAISKKHQFIYCRIPKAANSSVIATLHNAEYCQSSLSKDEINRIKMTGYDRPSQLSRTEADTAKSNYFTFTIARHPYNRLVSAYRDKVENTSKIKLRKPVLDFLNRPTHSTISLDDFLDFLEFGNGLSVNYHWARQSDILAVPANQLSFIGKVENMENDLSFIVKQIFGTEKEVIRWSPHSTQNQPSSVSLQALTQEQTARICSLYQEDFETFQYDTSMSQ